MIAPTVDSRHRRLGWTMAAIGAALLLAAPPTAAAQETSESASCTRKSGTFTPGAEVDPVITLTADQPAYSVNFGGERDWQFVDVVLRASRPLPARVSADQLDLEVLRRLVRQGSTATTVASKPMTFTEPKLNPRKNVITFTICIPGDELEAGRYLGAVSVEGPPGVGPVDLTIGANAQDERLFRVTVIVTGVLVLLLLIWRGATTEQKDRANEVARDVKEAPTGADNKPDVSAETKAKADKAAGNNARVRFSVGVLKSPTFWLTTIVSAALALGAAWTIYSQNAGWGSDPWVDAFSVGSAILAAAGFRSLLLTTTGK